MSDPPGLLSWLSQGRIIWWLSTFDHAKLWLLSVAEGVNPSPSGWNYDCDGWFSHKWINQLKSSSHIQPYDPDHFRSVNPVLKPIEGMKVVLQSLQKGLTADSAEILASAITNLFAKKYPLWKAAGTSEFNPEFKGDWEEDGLFLEQIILFYRNLITHNSRCKGIIEKVTLDLGREYSEESAQEMEESWKGDYRGPGKGSTMNRLGCRLRLFRRISDWCEISRSEGVEDDSIA